MLWVKDQMTSGLFTLQQDGAPAHRAQETVQLPDLWDPRSGHPTLSPKPSGLWNLGTITGMCLQ